MNKLDWLIGADQVIRKVNVFQQGVRNKFNRFRLINFFIAFSLILYVSLTSIFVTFPEITVSQIFLMGFVSLCITLFVMIPTFFYYIFLANRHTGNINKIIFSALFERLKIPFEFHQRKGISDRIKIRKILPKIVVNPDLMSFPDRGSFPDLDRGDSIRNLGRGAGSNLRHIHIPQHSLLSYHTGSADVVSSYHNDIWKRTDMHCDGFNGYFVAADFHKNFKGFLGIIPTSVTEKNSDLIDLWKKEENVKTVEVGSVEFQENFTVFTNNSDFAKIIISPALADTIIGLERNIKKYIIDQGKPTKSLHNKNDFLRLFFIESKAYLLIEYTEILIRFQGWKYKYENNILDIYTTAVGLDFVYFLGNELEKISSKIWE